MGRMKTHFMERMEKDPEFRRDAELAELRQLDPELPECNEEEGQGSPGRDQADTTFIDNLF